MRAESLVHLQFSSTSRPGVTGRRDVTPLDRAVSPAPAGGVTSVGRCCVHSSAVGVEDGVECDGQLRKVSVVDAPVVELPDELLQDWDPAPSSGHRRSRNRHLPLNDAYCSKTGGRRAGLFPGAVPARRRAPLRDGPAPRWRDGPTAPATSLRRRPSVRPAGLEWPQSLAVPAQLLRGHSPALSLPLSSTSRVAFIPLAAHGSDDADGPSVTRHHELPPPTLQEVCAIVILNPGELPMRVPVVRLRRPSLVRQGRLTCLVRVFGPP